MRFLVRFPLCVCDHSLLAPCSIQHVRFCSPCAYIALLFCLFLLYRVSGGLNLLYYASSTACSLSPTTSSPTLPPSPPTTAPTSPWTSVYNAAATIQCGGTATGNTATSGAHLFGNAAREVVYRFTVATTTTITINTCGSSYDTWLRCENNDC